MNRADNGQNAKCDPVIMAQQVELPFTDSPAGRHFTAVYAPRIRAYNFPRITDSQCRTSPQTH